MRIVSILSALLVAATLYMVVLERDVLRDLAQGDVGALGRTGAADLVRGAFGAERAPEAADAAAADPAGNGSEDAVAEAPAEPAEAPAERTVAVVSQISPAREIDRAVVLRGRTEAARTVEVRAETSGRVISEPRRRGAFVEAGEILCELAPGTRFAALAEAEARFEEARISADAAERLSPEGFASELRLAGARAARQMAEAAVSAAREEIERLTIRAPFGGVLETDSAELGSLLQPGTACATVIQLDPIRLIGFVPEMSVDKIALGAPAAARLASGRDVVGAVTFVARAADPATRTFRVEITVPNEDLTIRDGQSADIAVSAPGTEAHLLPASALTLDDDGRLGLRTVDADSRVRFVPVELLRDDREGVWVAGPEDGAEVIVVGQEFVTEGVRVTATRREADAAPDTGETLIEAIEAGDPVPSGLATPDGAPAEAQR